MFRLQIETPPSSPSSLTLAAGFHTVGGGADDAVRIPGAASVARLEVSREAVIVVARAPGVCAAGRPLERGERRLLRPGEALTCGAATLRVEAVAGIGLETTDTAARAMLAAEIAGAPQRVRPSLVWLSGRDCGRRMLLERGATFIGRGEGAGARVLDALASQLHARVTLRADGAVLSDLGSTNGVLVDGERIESDHALRGGEVLRIGDTDLAFEAGELAAAPDAAAPAPAQADAPAVRPETPLRMRALPRARRLDVALVAAAGSGLLLAMAVAAWLAVQ